MTAETEGASALYKRFEDKFRGPRDLVKRRLEGYAPVLDVIERRVGAGAAAVDVGCGRGEWIELLASRGWCAVGVDINDDMIDDARAIGLDARQADGLAFLQAQDEASVGLVSAMHVVEHVPQTYLGDMIKAAYRALAPGGLLIFETPNPENITVSSWSFHLDPSHLKPLPPELLAFLVRDGGFETTEIVTLNGASPAADQGKMEEMVWTLFTAGPDYAIVALKAAADSADATEIAAVAAAMSQPRSSNITQVTALARAADQAISGGNAVMLDRLEAVGHSSLHHDQLILRQLDSVHSTVSGQMEAVLHHDKLLLERVEGFRNGFAGQIEATLHHDKLILEHIDGVRSSFVEQREETLYHDKLILERIEDVRGGVAGQAEVALYHDKLILERVETFHGNFTGQMEGALHHSKLILDHVEGVRRNFVDQAEVALHHDKLILERIEGFRSRFAGEMGVALHHDTLILERLAGQAEQIDAALRQDAAILDRMAAQDALMEAGAQHDQFMRSQLDGVRSGVARHTDSIDALARQDAAILESMAAQAVQLEAVVHHETIIMDRLSRHASQIARQADQIAGQINQIASAQAFVSARAEVADERWAHARYQSDFIHHQMHQGFAQIVAELAGMRAHQAHLDQINASQAAEMAAIRASTSWRITAPIRGARRVFGRILGRATHAPRTLARHGVGAAKSALRAPLEVGLKVGRRYPSVARLALAVFGGTPWLGPRLTQFAHVRGYGVTRVAFSEDVWRIDASPEALQSWRLQLAGSADLAESR